MECQDPNKWQEIAPGVYARPVDEVDMYYATNVKVWEATGHTASAITAHVGIEFKKSIGKGDSSLHHRIQLALQYAWKKIRRETPLLATTVEYDSENKPTTRQYKVPTDADVEAWMAKTLIIKPVGSTSEEFLESDPPVPQASIFLFPMRSGFLSRRVQYNIVFRSPHDVIDGMATYHLLHHLLGFIKEGLDAQETSSESNLRVEFGDEYANLTPPLRIALGLPPTCKSPFPEIELQSIRKERAESRAMGMGIPFKKGATMPGKSLRVSLQLTKEETKQLLAVCKNLKATITPAAHTAIALAVRDSQPKGAVKKEGHYVSYAIVNLRKHCIHPYNTEECSTIVCHSNTTSSLVVKMAVPATASQHQSFLSEFKEVLEQVKTFYNENTKNVDKYGAVRCFAARTPAWPVSTTQVPDPTNNGKPSVSLSSRGVTDDFIQHEYGRFKVVDPWAVGTELSAGYGISVATWQGKMCLRAAYNEVYHDKVEALKFLKLVKKNLLEGLGVIRIEEGPSTFRHAH